MRHDLQFKPFLPRRRTEVDDRIAVLSLEVRKTKAELDALSPTAQFAAYFKKERHLTKLTTELNALSKFLLAFARLCKNFPAFIENCSNRFSYPEISFTFIDWTRNLLQVSFFGKGLLPFLGKQVEDG